MLLGRTHITSQIDRVHHGCNDVDVFASVLHSYERAFAMSTMRKQLDCTLKGNLRF